MNVLLAPSNRWCLWMGTVSSTTEVSRLCCLFIQSLIYSIISLCAKELHCCLKLLKLHRRATLATSCSFTSMNLRTIVYFESMLGHQMCSNLQLKAVPRCTVCFCLCKACFKLWCPVILENHFLLFFFFFFKQTKLCTSVGPSGSVYRHGRKI